MNNKNHRVVITGIGCISPIGNNVKEFSTGIKTGVCGIDYITRIPIDSLKVKLAGEVKNYDSENYFDRKQAKRFDRYTQYAIIATEEAVKDSNIDFSDYDDSRIGVYIGSGVGGIETLSIEIDKCKDKGPRMVSPFMVPMMIINMAAGEISIKYGLHGASMAFVTACASGTHAIGEAYRSIKHGYHDVMVTGGAESAINLIAMAGFQNMTALSLTDDKNAASLPFDKRRSGFVMGEGGAILIMESLESAQKRGAKIYGEITGYGATSDAYHMTSPDPEGKGAASAMKIALNEACLAPSDIDYINAHGTGTPLNDKFEAKAIHGAFGEYADKVLVNSTKSMTGHLLGGSGALEGIATLLQMKEGYVHKVVNLKEQDEECNLNIAKTNVKKEINNAMSNSLGFGGHNASIIISKFIK